MIIYDHRSTLVCACVRKHVDTAVGLFDRADGLGQTVARMLTECGSECEAFRIMREIAELRILAMSEIRAAQYALVNPPPCTEATTDSPRPIEILLPTAAA